MVQLHYETTQTTQTSLCLPVRYSAQYRIKCFHNSLYLPSYPNKESHYPSQTNSPLKWVLKIDVTHVKMLADNKSQLSLTRQIYQLL